MITLSKRGVLALNYLIVFPEFCLDVGSMPIKICR